MATCAILYNPASGKKTFESHLPEVERRLTALGYTCNVHATAYAGHAETLVKEILKSPVDMLVVSGGDGTFNEVLNGLMSFDTLPSIAYIPTGTSCDIGKSLGISKDIDKALSVIEANHLVHMDVVWSNQGYFTYVSAIGSYIDISYKTPSKLKRFLGYFAYIIIGVKSFFTIPKIPMQIQTETSEISGTFSLALILNTKRVASFTMMKRPILDDGYVDVLLYRYTPFLNNIIFLFSFILGKKILPRTHWFKMQSGRFISQTRLPWNQDGEKAQVGELQIKVIPKRLPIIVAKERLKYFPNQ